MASPSIKVPWRVVQCECDTKCSSAIIEHAVGHPTDVARLDAELAEHVVAMHNVWLDGLTEAYRYRKVSDWRNSHE